MRENVCVDIKTILEPSKIFVYHMIYMYMSTCVDEKSQSTHQHLRVHNPTHARALIHIHYDTHTHTHM